MTSRRRSKYTEDQLRQAVAKSKSWKGVCLILGIPPFTGSQSHITKVIKSLGVDYSHFTGKGWNKGRQFKKRNAIEYCFNGSTIPSSRLRENLIRDGYKENKCEICGLTDWLGDPLPLELDHKDSNHWNNELENLQIICANCHAVETKKRIIIKRITSRKSLRSYKYSIIVKNGIQTYRIKPKKTKEEISLTCSEAQKKRYSNSGMLDSRAGMITNIMALDIDFSKFGWVQEVSKNINVSHTQVKRFMSKYMQDFYNKCYKRRSRKNS